MRPTSARWLCVPLLLGALCAQAAGISRGPFLQQVGATRAVIVLHTDAASTVRIRFGTSADSLGVSVSESSASVDHAIELTGLTANTRYFYAVDLDGVATVSGPQVWLRTAPALDSATPFRFFVVGDTGTGDAGQLAVASRMLEEVAPPAFILHLGDLAYPTADTAALDTRFFGVYEPLLARSPVWPTIGETEAAVPDAGAYQAAFLLPANNPTSSELYYSFDWGNAHLLALATEVEPFTGGSPQLTFAQADLGGTGRQWRFVFFHRPPYSGGTVAGDPQVRSAIVPVLESNFTDLVFSGHSHVAERTQLLQSNTPAQSSTDGGYDKTGAPNQAIYLVSGVGGQQGALLDAGLPEMAFQLGNVNGLEVIDVAGPVLHGYFLQADGTVRDQFSLRKGTDLLAPVPLAARAGPEPTKLRVQFNEPVQAGGGVNGAESAGNYLINPTLGVTQAVLGPDLRTVTLTTAAHTPGTYTVIVNGVADRAVPPNVIDAGIALTYLFADAGIDGGTDGGGGGGGSIPGGGSGGEPIGNSGCTGCSAGGLAVALAVMFRRRR